MLIGPEAKSQVNIEADSESCVFGFLNARQRRALNARFGKRIGAKMKETWLCKPVGLKFFSLKE